MGWNLGYIIAESFELNAKPGILLACLQIHEHVSAFTVARSIKLERRIPDSLVLERSLCFYPALVYSGDHTSVRPGQRIHKRNDCVFIRVRREPHTMR